MKKLQRIVFLFILFSSGILYAQRTKAVLYFKNGTEIIGLGKLKGKTKVKFRKSKKEKAIKYDFKDLKRVKIYEDDAVNTYVYLKVKDQEKYKVLEEVILEKLSLYRIVTHGQHVGFGGFGGAPGGMGFGMSTSYTIKSYYVKKENEKEVYHLGSTSLFSKNFKKAASKYFKDCNDLVERIQTKEYKKRDIRAIVEFYNTECN